MCRNFFFIDINVKENEKHTSHFDLIEGKRIRKMKNGKYNK